MKKSDQYKSDLNWLSGFHILFYSKVLDSVNSGCESIGMEIPVNGILHSKFKSDQLQDGKGKASPFHVMEECSGVMIPDLTLIMHRIFCR